MERLTQRDNDGNAYWSGKNGKSYSDIKGNIYGVGSTKLADYEDAEENGLLIHLPCRVGDTVYFPQETNGECEPYVDVGTVFAIGIDERHTMWISVRYESGLKFYHTSDDIGKTVFLAREKAEQALANMKGV